MLGVEVDNKVAAAKVEVRDKGDKDKGDKDKEVKDNVPRDKGPQR